MPPMSGLALAEFDRDQQDMGCCSCLGFLRKTDTEMDSFLGEDFEGDYGEYGGYFNDDQGKIPGLPGCNRVICREVPVKLTTQLTMGEDEAGEKMINEYVRECNIGRGSYGKVVLYRKTTDGKKYAIKAFYKSRLSKIRVTCTETAWTDVLREANLFAGDKEYDILLPSPQYLDIYRINVTDGSIDSMQGYLIYWKNLHSTQDLETLVPEAATDCLQVSIMKTLEHPNIINLIEVIDDSESDRFYMVLEYVEGKCICDASGSCGGIGEDISRRRLRDIISGLMYLHAHDVVHGDIKPENLLVTKGGAVKIGDFSISHAFEDDNDLRWRSPGTPVFTAPECCIGLTYHGKTADVWAVGVTLYCMILGYCPFIGDSLQDTYDKIVHSPLHIPDDVDSELKDLLCGLLCKDPSQRITLESAAKHPWVIREAEPIPQSSCKCRFDRSIKDDSGSSETSSR